MSDYTNLDLDAQLVSNNSLANQGTLTTGFQLDNELERDAITLPKIRNFSFSSGQGGTLTLGGTNDGNGVLYVKNAAGSTIITANNNGISITGGNITIQNSGGTTILDATGLKSLANFESNAVSANAQDITNTSFVDLTSLSLTTSNFSRSAKTLMMFECLMQIDASDGASNYSGYGLLGFNVDGVGAPAANTIQELASRVSGSYTDGVGFHTVSMFHLMTLGTGTHVIKVEGKVANTVGAGKMKIFGNGQLLYFVLGN